MKKGMLFIILLTSTICFAGDNIVKLDSTTKAKLITIDTLVVKSDSLTQAMYDSIALAIKTDSLKEVAITLKATVSKDSAFILTDEGIIVVDKNNVFKPTGKNFWDYMIYIVFCGGILLLILISTFVSLSKIPFLKNSGNVMIQRMFAETSTFMKKPQIIAATIASLGTTALGLQGSFGFITPDILSFVQTLTIVALAIAGGAVFTSKNPEHNNSEIKIVPKMENGVILGTY